MLTSQGSPAFRCEACDKYLSKNELSQESCPHCGVEAHNHEGRFKLKFYVDYESTHSDRRTAYELEKSMDSRIERMRQDAKALSDDELMARIREIRTKRNTRMSTVKEQSKNRGKKKETLKDLLSNMSKEDLAKILKEMS